MQFSPLAIILLHRLAHGQLQFDTEYEPFTVPKQGTTSVYSHFDAQLEAANVSSKRHALGGGRGRLQPNFCAIAWI